METEKVIGGLFGSGLIVAFFVAWIASVVWAFRDARRRGKSGLLVALMVILLPWPAGLLAWLVFRPRTRLRGPMQRSRRPQLSERAT